MDTLHSVLRAIKGERKTKPDHLTVFQEFLKHLERANRTAPPKTTRPKPPRRKPRPRSA